MTLETILNEMLLELDTSCKRMSAPLHLLETGRVLSAGNGIAFVSGLPGLRSEELVLFRNGLVGMAMHLEPNEVSVVLFGNSNELKAGDTVRRTERLADTPVGFGLLGRVVDATGLPLDGLGPVNTDKRRLVECPAPAIIDRAPVTVPLQTGIKAIDALIPIGRGQRELIIGDRQTGKTAVAVDTIINQRDKDVICIYCAIGQRGTAVAKVVESLRVSGVMDQCIVVVAAGEDAPGLQFITPYAAVSMGEYFMESGRDVLVVFDDLTRHARAYRELSLLLRRPPGREAYPGDIFYIHSRLLERATHLSHAKGGGSLTAMPIVETQANNISAYIPTNLISITDGQIYLSPEMFRMGQLPAIDVGKSVSRVGGKTQLPILRKVAADLRLAYSQFQELESFARFATRIDDDTRAAIERGKRVREVLKQGEHDPLRVSEQVATFMALNSGLLDSLELTDVQFAEKAIRDSILNELPDICQKIDTGGLIVDSDWHRILETASLAINHLKN